VPYVTSIARITMCDMITDALLTRFGDAANDLAKAIPQLHDADKYRILRRAIATATTLAEVEKVYAEFIAPPRRKRGSARRNSPNTHGK
jgi:hypothetical protein